MIRTILFTSLLAFNAAFSSAFAESFILTSPDLQEGQQLKAAQVFQGFGVVLA